MAADFRLWDNLSASERGPSLTHSHRSGLDLPWFGLERLTHFVGLSSKQTADRERFGIEIERVFHAGDVRSPRFSIAARIVRFASQECQPRVGTPHCSKLHIVVADNKDLPIAGCWVCGELPSYLIEQSRSARVII